MPRQISSSNRNLYFELLQKLWTEGEVDAVSLSRSLGIEAQEARRKIDFLYDKLPGLWIEKPPHQSKLLLRGIGSFTDTLLRQMAEKQKLASWVARNCLKPGDDVALGSGSTVAYVGQEIIRRGMDVRIITNNEAVLLYLSGIPDTAPLPTHVESTGGAFSRQRKCFYGEVALRAFQARYAAKAVVSFSGLTSEGDFLMLDTREHPIAKELMAPHEYRKSIIMPLDSQKIGYRRRFESPVSLKQIPQKARSKYLVVTVGPLTDAQREAIDNYKRLRIRVEVLD